MSPAGPILMGLFFILAGRAEGVAKLPAPTTEQPGKSTHWFPFLSLSLSRTHNKKIERKDYVRSRLIIKENHRTARKKLAIDYFPAGVLLLHMQIVPDHKMAMIQLPIEG